MLNGKKQLIAASTPEFTSLSVNMDADNSFPVRNTDNQKIEVADLFTHFTASIIREDVPFTR